MQLFLKLYTACLFLRCIPDFDLLIRLVRVLALSDPCAQLFQFKAYYILSTPTIDLLLHIINKTCYILVSYNI